MALWVRVVLWMLVAVVPGGILLVPLLARDAWRRSKQGAMRSLSAANPECDEATSARRLPPAAPAR